MPLDRPVEIRVVEPKAAVAQRGQLQRFAFDRFGDVEARELHRLRTPRISAYAEEARLRQMRVATRDPSAHDRKELWFSVNKKLQLIDGFADHHARTQYLQFG